MKKHYLLIIPLAALIGLVFTAWSLNRGTFGAITGIQRRNHVALIGTSASPSTLTTSFTGGGAASSTANPAAGFAKFAFAGSYLPKSYGSVLSVLVERSLDASCSNYRPFTLSSTVAGDTDETLVYTNGTSSAAGIPFTVPGSYGTTKTTSGTAITFSFDVAGIAECLKVSAREQTTSTAGTLFLETLMQSD